jgi:TrmH family RNA methyltransferase
MQRVSSRHNPRLREAARLLASSRDRRKANRCVLEGEHLVAVYCERVGAPETLVVTEEALANASLAALVARVSAADVLVVPRAAFAELATLPAEIGVLAVVAPPAPDPAPPGGFCLLLEDIQDPGNAGSMLRSAAAAGARQVYLSKGCAFAWAPRVLRAGQGAHFHLAIHEDVDLPAWARAYRKGGGHVAATVARGGEALFGAKLGRRVALAVGNEGAGLSPALLAEADVRVTIPMPGGVESLNAAAAAAVALFDCVRRGITA